MAYAQGRRAFGFCDRCQFRRPLAELRFEVVAAKRTNLRVCETCFDVDHPQLLLGRKKVWDPITLRDPRPPMDIDLPAPSASGELFAEDGSPIQDEFGNPILLDGDPFAILENQVVTEDWEGIILEDGHELVLNP